MTQYKEYALVRAESIRGIVHTVQRDPEMKSFLQTHERQKVSESLSGSEPGWSTKMFHVNYFYQNFLNGKIIQDQ